MDTTTLLFGLMTATLIGMTWQARRLDNAQRDVALLGVVGGLCGVGTAVSVIL